MQIVTFLFGCQVCAVKSLCPIMSKIINATLQLCLKIRTRPLTEFLTQGEGTIQTVLFQFDHMITYVGKGLGNFKAFTVNTHTFVHSLYAIITATGMRAGASLENITRTAGHSSGVGTGP